MQLWINIQPASCRFQLIGHLNYSHIIILYLRCWNRKPSGFRNVQLVQGKVRVARRQRGAKIIKSRVQVTASVLRFSSKTAKLAIDWHHVSSRDVVAFDNTTARDDKTGDQTILNELIVGGLESVVACVNESVLHKQAQVTLLDNLREQSSHHSATICFENVDQ